MQKSKQTTSLAQLSKAIVKLENQLISQIYQKLVTGPERSIAGSEPWIRHLVMPVLHCLCLSMTNQKDLICHSIFIKCIRQECETSGHTDSNKYIST